MLEEFIKHLNFRLVKLDQYRLTAINEDLLDLLNKMLDLNPANRISPDDILKHKYITSFENTPTTKPTTGHW